MSASFLARTLTVISLCIWVVGVFFCSQLVVGVVIGLVPSLGGVIAQIGEVASATLLSVIVYGLTIGILLGSGNVFPKLRADRETMGVNRWISWGDIGSGVLAILPYFILSALAALAVTALTGGNELNQNQALPFKDLGSRVELLLAFATLVVAAPLAEEMVFRGYLYGKLREQIVGVGAIVVSAVVFGLLHLPGAITDGTIDLQTAAALDTFVLGMVLASLREFTGSIWAGVILHMMKNLVAFYFLFILPATGGTL